MKTSHLTLLVSLVFIGITFVSCSGGKDPVTPGSSDLSANSEIVFSEKSIGKTNRTTLSVYHALINPESGTFEVNPAQRTADYHLELSSLYPGVLEITDYGYTPNFWADIKITHPLPGSGIDAFDPRVIAVLPANEDVSFYYPIFNCYGNNRVVLEPDGYVKQYDHPGGAIYGNTDPFKAYFKDQSYRRWSSTGPISETQRWEMDINGFGGPLEFMLIVDVSTNYPDSPQPVIDNVLEPAQISGVVLPGLTSQGRSAEIQVTFLDWQGPSDIKCKVESPELFDGAIQVFYQGPGPNPDEYVFTGTIFNDNLAPVGEASVLIAAWDIPSDIHIFNEITATVDPDPMFNIEEVTPLWLRLQNEALFVDGNYMYVRDYTSGICIFDISDLSAIRPVGSVELNTLNMRNFCVSDGYAYGSNFEGLVIIDIDPPELSHVVNTVVVPRIRFSDVVIADGFVFATCCNYNGEDDGLYIFDINPPESASLEKLVRCDPKDVAISDGYAFLPAWNDGLHIVDIDPIESASIVETIEVPGKIVEISIFDDYAYVTDADDALHIFDISNPESTFIVNTIPTDDRPHGVFSDGDYAYSVINNTGLLIFNVNPPQDAYLVNTVEISCEAGLHQIHNDHAFVMSYGNIKIIDIQPPESAEIVSIFPTFEDDQEKTAIDTDGEFIYATNHDDLHIINAAIPESAFVIRSIVGSDPESGRFWDIAVKDGYAYTSYQEPGGPDSICVFDVDPPETACIVDQISTTRIPYNLVTSGNYLYVASWENGLRIFDITNPLDISHVLDVDTPGKLYDVFVDGDYAYVTEYDQVYIIDITDPHSPLIIKTLDDLPYDAKQIFVSNGYAYTTRAYHNALQIIDVDPPSTAHLVNAFMELESPGYMGFDNGFLYVSDGGDGFKIMDITPPESAYVLCGSFPFECGDFFIQDGYLYSISGDINIIKLW